MNINEAALASARLSGFAPKSGEDLKQALRKWFSKHFIKGMKISTLRAMFTSDAFTAYEAWLREANLSEVLTIVKKIDPHNSGIMAASEDAIRAHIGLLASGQLDPAEKPKRDRKGSGRGVPPTGESIIAGSRYGTSNRR